VEELNVASSGEISVPDDEKGFTTAYDLIAQWKIEGKSFGGAAETLKRMGSKLVGGPGGNNSSRVSQKSKVASGNLVRGRYK